MWTEQVSAGNKSNPFPHCAFWIKELLGGLICYT